MIELRFKSKYKEKLEALSYILSEGIAGWDAFVDNAVVVTDPQDESDSDKPALEYTTYMIIGPGAETSVSISIDMDAQTEESLDICTSSAESLKRFIGQLHLKKC